ncbi:MAG: hypothetical protein Q8R25_01600 [bacterium]|nr:hypothetical protein [bacterium]
MSINAEVTKTGNETALATIRKFTRRVQGANLVKTVRAGRYFVRDTSKIVKKKRALKMLKKRADYRQAVKEGKIIEAAPRHQYTERPRHENSNPTKFGEGTPIAR